MSRWPLLPLAALLLVAACGEETEGPAVGSTDTGSAETPAAPAAPEPETGTEIAAAPQATAPVEGSEEAPFIYLALEKGQGGQPHSIVFAIDQGKDGTPANDRAIRITPQEGLCNPQELSRYRFPEGARPAFSPEIAARGITAKELPNFMAVQVTSAMMQVG
ncbi:MAG: hypothetical protein AAF074_25360, partial [Pseudomonadota bacterium]